MLILQNNESSRFVENLQWIYGIPSKFKLLKCKEILTVIILIYFYSSVFFSSICESDFNPKLLIKLSK